MPLRLRDQVIGALNLFRTQVGVMEEADVLAAQTLADVATIAILQHRAVLNAQVVNGQLQRALNNRVVIEQAKGRLAEQAGLDMERAFTRLRHHARSHSLRLVEVAHRVVDGTLTPGAFDPQGPSAARR